MPWHSTGPHYCQVCPVTMNRKGDRRIDPPLELVKQNYSGCSVDIGQCPTCHRYFEISYKVDRVLDVTADVERAKQVQEEHNRRK